MLLLFITCVSGATDFPYLRFALVLGGTGSNLTELWTGTNAPGNYDWESMAKLREFRAGYPASSTDGYVVVVAGGVDAFQNALSSAELLDLTSISPTWTKIPSLDVAVGYTAGAYFPLLKLFLVLGGFQGGNHLSLARGFNKSENRWVTLPDLPIGRSSHGVVVYGNSVVVLGGYGKGGLFLTTADQLLVDARGDLSWDIFPPLLVPREYFACAVVRGLIFVAGGQDNSGMLKSVEVFNNVTRSWSLTAEAQLLSPRTLWTGGSISGKFLTLGGSSSKVLLYDPIIQAWQDGPMMNQTIRLGPALVTFDAANYPQRSIMIAAGGSGGRSVSAFSSVLNHWVDLQPMAFFRDRTPASCTYGDSFYIVGGSDGTSTLSSFESYNFNYHKWTTLPSMAIPRAYSSGLIIPETDAFIVSGGSNSVQPLNSTEMFNFTTQTWSSFPDMPSRRGAHGLAFFYGGLLIISGYDGAFTVGDVNFFNLETNQWKSHPSVNDPRSNFAHALIRNSLYIAGGFGLRTSLNTVEYLKSTSAYWTRLPSIPTFRLTCYGAEYLGFFVVMGGPDMTLDIYDPLSRIWTSKFLPNLSFFMTYGSLATLSDEFVLDHSVLESSADFLPNISSSISSSVGFIIAAGGDFLSSAEIYNTSSNKWTSLPPMSLARSRSPASAFFEDKFFIAGGNVNSSYITNTAEYFDLKLGIWIQLPPMLFGPRRSTFGTIDPSASNFVICGGFSGTTVATCEMLDLTSYTWSNHSILPLQRNNHVLLVFNSSLLVIGGEDGTSLLSSCDLFDQKAGSWLTFPSLQFKRKYFGAAVLGDIVYVSGGYNGSTDINSVEYFKKDDWKALPFLPEASRTRFVLVPMAGKLVTVGGLFTFEIFDPSSLSWNITTIPFMHDKGRVGCAAVGFFREQLVISSTSPPPGLPAASASSLNVVVAVVIIAVVMLITILLVVFVLIRRKQNRHRIHEHVSLELQRIEALQARSENLLRRNFPHIVAQGTDPGHNQGAAGLSGPAHSIETISLQLLTIEKQIGEGSSGVVSIGKLRVSGSAVPLRCAVKSLRVGVTLEEEIKFLCECKLLSLLRHPHIVRLIGVCMESSPMLMVMEYMARGNLRDYLREQRVGGRTEELRVLEGYVGQVCSALVFLEKNKVLHRDVAARNVLVGEQAERVKLSDFGLSRWMDSADYYHQLSEERIPFKWLPLESIEDKIFTTKSDVWSFGVFMWEVFSLGESPYALMSAREVIVLLKTGERLPCPKGCPDHWYKMMRSCWEAQAKDRASFAQLNEQALVLSKGTSRPTLSTVLHRPPPASSHFHANPYTVDLQDEEETSL